MTSGTDVDDNATRTRTEADDTQAATPVDTSDAASDLEASSVSLNAVLAEDAVKFDAAVSHDTDEEEVEALAEEADAPVEEADAPAENAELAEFDDAAAFSGVDDFFATTAADMEASGSTPDTSDDDCIEDSDTSPEDALDKETSEATFTGWAGLGAATAGAASEGRDSASWQKQEYSAASATPPQKGKADKQATPKPPRTGFFGTHPILAVEPSMPPSASTHLYNFLSYIPWLVLGLMLVAQTFLALDVRSLWFSDEVRHAAAFREFLDGNSRFLLHMNGEVYPDKPPLYFWFLHGLYQLLQVEGPLLYLGAAAVSGLLYVLCTCLLGRFVGRFDGRSILAGGIILLSSGFVMGVTHYARMDLLFSSVILLSHIALFFAWTKERSLFWCVIGFALGGVACLVKGPLGLALPLASSLLFLLWRGRITRLFRVDVFLGLLVGVGVVGAWLAGVYLETGGPEFILSKLLQEQVVQRAVNASHHKEDWAFYFIRLPLMLLPWGVLLLCLPYHRILGKKSRTAIKASRTPEAEGMAYLWCMVLSAFLVLSLVSTKIFIYLLPALPALALLAGRAVLQMSGFRATLFRFLLTVTMMASGVVLLVATFMLCGMLPIPSFLNVPGWSIPANFGFMTAASVMAVAALALWLLLRSSRPEGLLLIMGLYAVLVCFPLFVMGAPSLDAVMSPKAQSELIRAYAEKGYYPVTYRVYEGTYTYYSGQKIHSVSSLEELDSLKAKHPSIIFAAKTQRLEGWQKPECFEEVNRQWIESSEYVVLACPPDPSIVVKPSVEPAPIKSFLFAPALPAKKAQDAAAKEKAAMESPAPEAAPGEVAPAEAASDEAAPVEAVSDEAVPAENAPVEAVSDEDVSGEAASSGASPTEVAPGEVASDEVVPAEAVSDETAPDETAPVEAVSDEAVPAENAPVEAAPGDAVSDEAVPAEATEPVAPETAPAHDSEAVDAPPVPDTMG